MENLLLIRSTSHVKKKKIMDREKLIRVVLESEKELYLEDIRRLQEKDYPDSFFLVQ